MTRPEHTAHDADVAIVGYGPSGVIAATYLGMAGISTVVLEKDKDLYSRARAVTVNDWTLRIFQEFGVAERVKQDMDPARGMTWKTYTGQTVFHLDVYPGELGQPAAMMIYQPDMEQELRNNCAQHESLDLRFGHAFTKLSQDSEGVTLTATDAADNPYDLRVKYVIGADGGSSRVREAAGYSLVGDTKPRRWLVIDGAVRKPWPGHDELVFWSDQTWPVVDIPLAKGNHRWEIPLNDGERDDDYESEERVWERLAPLGITEENVTIKGWAFYSHHVRHLEKWRAGRVVMIGDAAHLMPPWAGQGMQSGIRDAQNIAWKIEALVHGRVGEDILDTVQSERWMHVKEMTDISMRLGRFIEMEKGWAVGLRNWLAPKLQNVKLVIEALRPKNETNRFVDGWATGRTGRRSAVGRMIPQPQVTDASGTTGLLDDLAGRGFLVFGLGTNPRHAMSPTQAQAWSALGARFLTVHPATDTATDPDSLVDHTGLLGDWAAKFDARVLVVRPDRLVAATDATGLDVPAPRGNLKEK